MSPSNTRFDGLTNEGADLGPTLAVLDFDGDGYADIATSVSVSFTGPVFDLWHGGPGGPPSGNVGSRGFWLPGLHPAALAAVGDLNHDGYADLANVASGAQILYGPEPGAALGAGIACAPWRDRAAAALLDRGRPLRNNGTRFNFGSPRPRCTSTCPPSSTRSGRSCAPTTATSSRPSCAAR